MCRWERQKISMALGVKILGRAVIDSNRVK